MRIWATVPKELTPRPTISVGGHPNILGLLVNTEFAWFHKVFPQNFPGGDRRQQPVFFHFMIPQEKGPKSISTLPASRSGEYGSSGSVVPR
jgi:hypothetical protein